MEGEVVAQVSELAAMGKYIGAGIACFALLGAAIGLGNMFSGFFEGAFRNPSAAAEQKPNLILGAGLAEAAGILGFVVAMLIVFL